MVRAVSFLLSFWLALIFICGHGAHLPQLLDFAVGLGALFAGLGAAIAPVVGRRTRRIGPIALALYLFALAYIAVSLPVPLWFPFCISLGAAILLCTRVATWLWSPRDRGTMAPADS